MENEPRSLGLRVAELFEHVVRRSATAAQRFPMDRAHHESRDNLLAYLALREQDIAELQLELADEGLSSLGRLEANVLYSIGKVLEWLQQPLPPTPVAVIQPGDARRLQRSRARSVFGRPRPNRPTRIMVTLDSSLLDTPAVFEDLLRSGMDVARINCAHDDPGTWAALVAEVRSAEIHLEGSEVTGLRRCHISMDLPGPKIRTGTIGAFGHAARPGLRVRPGDVIRIYRSPNVMGHEACGDTPAGFACTLPSALERVASGDRVMIDDGKVTAVVTAAAPGWIEATVTSPTGKSARIRPGKGLNFPDSSLLLPAMSPADRDTMSWIVAHADAVGFSFVHTAEDIAAMYSLLHELGQPDFPVIVKVETRDAVHNLAQILLAGMSHPGFAVMIARGDLAVEMGFEMLANLQEDILSLCEAAHVPVVWATQVLESLAHRGMPARAEITDAAAAQRADCVMLNKGPHIVEAVQVLESLLRSEARQREKKRPVFRDFTPQYGVLDDC